MPTTRTFLEASKRLLNKNTAINAGVLAAALAVTPIANVYKDLAHREGVGDNVTSVVTGELGVTQSAKDAVGATSSSDADVALLYLNLLNDKWSRVEGYEEAPELVKEILLDATYNLGESVMGYRGVRSALREGRWFDVGKELLDTANVGGRSMMGLAKRRAAMYNKVAQEDIFWIRQLEDGTLIYATFDTRVFEYKARGGKHEKSKAGVVIVPYDPSGLF